MKEFNFKFKDENGMHARPAGKLVKAASEFGSDIEIICGPKFADSKKLFSLMKMGIKYNDDVTIRINGEDEIEAEKSLKKFFDIIWYRKIDFI